LIPEQRKTRYTIHGQADTLMVIDNASSYIDFVFLSTGTDTLTFENANFTYGYINSLVIMPVAQRNKKHLTMTPNYRTIAYNGYNFVVNMTNIMNEYLDSYEVVPPDTVLPPVPDTGDVTILFAESWEDNNLGGYSSGEFDADFGQGTVGSQGVSLRDVSVVTGSGSNTTKVMQVDFPANSTGCCQPQQGGAYGGIVAYAALDDSVQVDEAYINYDIFFQAGFDFAQGGKLPASLMAGWWFDPFGRPELIGTTVATAGMMWNNNVPGAAEFYNFIPDTGASNSGKTWVWGLDMEDYFINGNPYYHPSKSTIRWSSEINSLLTTGVWHNITYRMVLNTVTGGVGNYDGLLEAWFDGAMVMQMDSIQFRNTTALKISTLRLTTFFGGNRDHPNYWHWENDHAEHLRIDNLNIYTYPQGSDVPTGYEFSPTNRIPHQF
jgi:hypothetical protein